MDFANQGLSGLVNMGNTCYLNSVLQCLSNTPDLTYYYITEDYVKDINIRNKEYQLCREYYKLIKGLWEENCIVKPISFKQTFGSLEAKFANSQQHDSHEVLITLINFLHLGASYKVDITYSGTSQNDLDERMIKSIESWRDNYKSEYSRMLDLFYGQYLSELTCKNCGESSASYNPFCSLLLPIHDVHKTLHDCLADFMVEEELDDTNKWKCTSCDKESNAKKKLTLWKVPQYLIITLKRFNFSGVSSKNNKAIEVPIDNLSLEKYTEGYDKSTARYELYGYINHYGNIQGGHYIAYCRNANGKWYEYNDSDVREASGNVSRLDNAYIFFYKKKEK